jgi:hypothetical protein
MSNDAAIKAALAIELDKAHAQIVELRKQLDVAKAKPEKK